MDSMDLHPSPQDPQDYEQRPQESSNPSSNPNQNLPFASFSLSLSLLTPTSTPTKIPPSLSSLPTTIKLPTQLKTLTTTPFSTSNPNSSRRGSSHLSISSSSLLSPFPIFTPRRRPSDPFTPLGASCRRALVWFRADLRLHDNEALSTAVADSSVVLPFYIFDPRDFGKSASGFDRTGPYRATFLLDSVADLRASLRARGGDLLVRIGRPETVITELARAAGADVVYAHREVSRDECRTEEMVEKAMEEAGVEVKYFWGSTLYHMEDLPFGLEEMPVNYGGFKEKVKGLAVRKVIEPPEEIKGMPLRNGLEPGEIPTLAELGLSTPAAMSQVEL